MQKSLWKTSYDLEPMGLPEPDCPFIRAHDEIKLHRLKGASARIFQGMRTHCTRYSAPSSRGRCHIPTIRDMRASSQLVCSNVVRAQNRTFFFGDKDLMIF